MKARDSLRRRIAIAYLLFAVATTLFFSVIAAVAVEGIEDRLVDHQLEQVAAWASPRVAAGLAVSLPAGLSFHHGGDIPLSLRGLAPGVHEIDVDGVGLHVLSGADRAGAFVVVDHESDYEKVELVVYSLFVVAFIGCLLFSVLLGRYIGRRIVTPILSLAESVRGGLATLPLLDRPDELGLLARAFAAHTAELRGYLDRERFFTGDVSHELRTPLTVITGAAEILVAHNAGNRQVTEPAERILRSANEASECVNVMLILARSPERLPHAPVDLVAIAEHETLRYQPLVAAKDVLLEFHLDQVLLSMRGLNCAAPPLATWSVMLASTPTEASLWSGLEIEASSSKTPGRGSRWPPWPRSTAVTARATARRQVPASAWDWSSASANTSTPV